MRFMWAALIVSAFFYGVFYTFLPLTLLPILVLPLCALAGFVIWALPATKEGPSRSLTGMFFAFFIALILWPNYLAISIPGLPWITVLRLVGIPMTLVLLVSLSRSPQLRNEIKEVLAGSPWIWKLLVTFVFIQAATLPLSGRPFTSLSRFMIAQINWTMIFFASCYVFRKRQRVFQWSLMLVIMALIVIAIGALEWRRHHVLWAGHLPAFLAVSDDVVQKILAGGTRFGVQYRTQSTFTTALSFAEYLALTTPFVIHVAVEGRRQATRLAAMVCVPVIFFGVFISGSRLGALGFFLSFLLYIAAWGWRRWRSDRSSIFGPAIILGYPAIFGAVVGASLVNLRLYRMIWGGGQYTYSTDARRVQLEMGIPKILHAPWGYGIGEAGQALQYYNPGGTLTVDNYWLTIALSYGIPGLIAYFGMFAAAIYYAARVLSRSTSYEVTYLLPAAIALANFVVIKTVFSQEANHPLAFMLLGLVAVLVWRASKEEQPPLPMRPIPPQGISL